MGEGAITVLHVDDDDRFRELTETFLERTDGHLDVVSADSGRAGLDALDRHDVDCIVSDYDMPEMDGLTLLAAVRERRPELPFVLFTGKGSEEIASEAITAGVSDYIQKSGRSEQYELLANRIRNLSNQYRAQLRSKRVFEAIDVVDEGVSLLDRDGTIRYVNRAYAKLFGYERDELIGERCSTLYPSLQDFERIQNVVEPCLNERGRWSGETVNVRRDGTEVLIDHTLVVTSDGTIVCLMNEPSEDEGH